MRDTFLIVDGNSLMHRAFHALPLMDYDGVYTNALHGFLNMLLRCMKERKPRWCAVAFDLPSPTFRHTAYADYKAGRRAMPEELRPQFPLIKEILAAMGMGVLSLTGYEADDILGTLSRQCREKGIDALLLTGDRDALQLVDDEITLLLTRKGISEVEECTPARVKELFRRHPRAGDGLEGPDGRRQRQHPRHPRGGGKDRPQAAERIRHAGKRAGPRGRDQGQAGRKGAGQRGAGPILQMAGHHPRHIPLDHAL